MSDGGKSSASTADARLSRRSLLEAAALTVLVGAGGGALAELLRDRAPVAGMPEAPAPLVAAIAAEVERIRALDAARSGDPAPLLTAIRANHVAHERALRSLLPAGASAARPAPSSASPSVSAPDRPALAAGEAAAGRAAAERALQLSGGAAALLASISACEATHAELLS